MERRTFDPRMFTTVILPLVLILIPGLQLVRFFSRSPDIWWTPATQLVSLADGEKQVRVYVRGTPLRSWLASAKLQVVTDSGTAGLSESDVGLRLNHWDQIRAEGIVALLINALMIGFGLGLALAGLVGIRQRPEKPATT